MSNLLSSSSGRDRRSGPILVGREREKAFLRECLDAMLDGHGSLVLVGGHAGIGKSTLVEWLAREAEGADCLILRGACYDLTSTPPYGPWVELVQGYQPSTSEPSIPAFLNDPAALDQVGSQEALFARAGEFLASVAAARPILLILEDLHWADPGSIGLLRFVGRYISRHRLLLVATHRSDDLPRHHPLFTVLPLIVREAGAERLDVRPLTGDENSALIRALYPLPHADQIRLEQYIETRAEGNPLYAHELMRTLEDEGYLKPRDDGIWQLEDPDQLPVPPFVLQVIERRLGRLDEETRQLLQLAAVIGNEVPVDLWQQVSQASDELLATAIRHGQNARLIEEAAANASYRFLHGLLRQALYEEAIVPQRRVWHRRIAEVLETMPHPDPDAVAYHYQQAKDAQALTWLTRAGERAQRAYAWITAADRFETALEMLDEQGAPATERARMRLRIASLRRYVNPVQSLSLLRDARRLAVEGGDAALAGHALFSIGALQCYLSDVRHGLPTMERAVVELRALPEADQAGIAFVPYANVRTLEGQLVPWLATVGRLNEAIDMAMRVTAAETAEVSPPRRDPAILAGVHYGLAMAHAVLGRPYPARGAYQQARAEYEAIEHHTMIVVLSVQELEEVQLPYFSENLPEHRRLAMAGEASVLVAAGAIPGNVAPRYVSLDLLIRDGRWHEARAIAEMAYRERLEPIRVFGYRCLALLAVGQGDIDLVWEIVRDVHPDGPLTDPGGVYLPTGMLLQRLAAEVALDRGDLPVARTWLEAHDRWLAWSGATLGHAEGQLGWARYHQATGDLGAARDHAESALTLATDPRQPLALIAVHRMLGRIDTAERQFAGADAHLNLSLALTGSCAARYERALTLLAVADCRFAQGLLEEATALLAEARETCDALGAAPAIAKVDALIARLATKAKSAVVYPAGLTEREVEVLRLVAEGLTDGEVAERLYLSPRTVSAHLRSVYNKIGVGSRAAATRFAAEHDLI